MLPLSMSEPAHTTPVHVADLAAGCVRFVHDALQLELDYSHETLPMLDHYLRETVAASKAEIQQLIAPAAGAYFGEVVRRHGYAVRWYAPQDRYRDYRLEFEDRFLHFNPIGVAVEALAREDAPGWSAHFQLLPDDERRVKAALEEAPAEAPGDYYRLAVRFDTLQQVVALLAPSKTSGDGPRHFSHEVYEAAVGQGSPESDTN